MKDENKIIQFVYTVFLGGLIAVFIAIGVNTFYPGPKYPEYPSQLNNIGENGYTQDQQKISDEYNKQTDLYNGKMKEHSRNASITVLVSSVLLLVSSLFYHKKIRVISDGVMLSGLFLLMYSIGLGLISGNSKYTFGAVSAGLVVSLVLGYQRFVISEKKNI